MTNIQALEAKLAKLEAENAALAAKVAVKNKISFKVSDKGALSIYGLGRFPVTLYISQYDRLIAAWSDVQAFVAANRDKFTTKE